MRWTNKGQKSKSSFYTGYKNEKTQFFFELSFKIIFYSISIFT